MRTLCCVLMLMLLSACNSDKQYILDAINGANSGHPKGHDSQSISEDDVRKFVESIKSNFGTLRYEQSSQAFASETVIVSELGGKPGTPVETWTYRLVDGTNKGVLTAAFCGEKAEKLCRLTVRVEILLLDDLDLATNVLTTSPGRVLTAPRDGDFFLL